MDLYQPMSKRPRMCGECPLDFGYPRIRSFTDNRLGVHICSVFTLMMSLISLPSFMKGFVVVTPEEDHYPIEKWPRDFGGLTCKGMQPSMSRNAISVKNTSQIYINRVGTWTRSLALSPLRSGVLDIIGPYPWATGNKRFVLVATDYFTKWVEVEALANIRDIEVKRFVWKNIVARFGVPEALISDNELQFDNKAFRKYCSSNLGIINRYSSLAYPQNNG